MRLRLAGLATIGAAAAVAAGPAVAVQDAKPTPCSGVLYTDKAGDQVVDTSGGQGVSERKGEDNLDIKRVFLNYRPGKDGKKILSANIEITNLTKDVPPESQGGVYYYVFYTFDGTERFVKAVNDGSGTITYASGYLDASSMAFIVYNTDGETTGNFFEGKDGIVQIDIPEAIGGKPAAKLANLFVDADIIIGKDDFVGLNSHSDSAPDSRAGKTYTVAECGGSGPGPETPVGPDVGPGTTPPAEPLPLSTPARLGSARKVNKKRALAMKVSASQTITGLTVSIQKSKGKSVLSGRLAKLSGSARIKLRRRGKLKKGSYLLLAGGTVDGRRRTLVKNITVKK